VLAVVAEVGGSEEVSRVGENNFAADFNNQINLEQVLMSHHIYNSSVPPL